MLTGKTSCHCPMSLPPRGGGDLIGRESPNSPYSTKVMTFEEDQGANDQFGAQGFIKVDVLRLPLGASAGRRGGAL